MKKALLLVLSVFMCLGTFSPVFADDHSHCEEGQIQDEDGNCVYPDDAEGEETEGEGSPLQFKF
jgi:hypothetical protein